MSRFLSPLDMELMRDADGRALRTRAGRPLYRLLAPFSYQSDVAGLIEIEAGFITDLFSQPIVSMLLLGDIGQEESVPHDFAYSKRTMSRALADHMLYEACVLNGLPRWKAALVWLGVRIGGASHWMPAPAVA